MIKEAILPSTPSSLDQLDKLCPGNTNSLAGDRAEEGSSQALRGDEITFTTLLSDPRSTSCPSDIMTSGSRVASSAWPEDEVAALGVSQPGW